MSWTISSREDGRIVLIKTEGTHTPADVRLMAEEALAVAEKQQAIRFLVDDRGMTPEFRTMEIYRLPRVLLDLGLPRDSKIAIVYSAASSKREDFKFLETTAGNLGGLTIRIFEDSLEPALLWLVSDR